ncbi:MAG: transglutaminase domain-containing protein [Dehalococcoidia bacterium]
MAGAASFEGIFGLQPRQLEPVRETRWYASRESWLTLALVMFTLFPVIGSLTSAEWVPEMPSMWLASGAGLAVGWLLAQSRVAGPVAGLVASALAIAVSVGLVIERMVVTEPGLGEGLRGRWTEFWLRMEEWGGAVVAREPSTDPLAFVVLLIMVVFGVAYFSAWSVVRWRNAWAALVPGGVVLLTNISYLPGQPSIALIIYLFAAVLLVTRLEFLRSAMRWRSERVGLPDLMSVVVLVIGLAVAAILVSVAWIVPTANHWGPVADTWQRVIAPVSERVGAFGEAFIGISSKKPVPAHAFGSTLPLQSQMTLNADPLYEVVTEREGGNLRGAVYDAYSSGGWSATGGAAPPLTGTTVQAAGLGTPQTRAQVREPVTTEITVLDEGAPDHRLLTVGDPLAADVPAARLLDAIAQPVGLIPEEEAEPGVEYTSVGAISVASVATLQSAGTEYPVRLHERFTELPDDLPADVARLTQDLTQSAANPYDAARRVESYLRSTYRYTLEPPDAPPRRDAVAAFLFDQRAGYFDHFASAMAVMLRTADIPTRVAVGFVLDPADLDSETKAYTLSEQRAWAWTEVYFPGLGWVEFNPTPSRPLVQRPGDDSDARAAAEEAGPDVDLSDLDGMPFPDELFEFDESVVDMDDDFGMNQTREIVVQVISTLLIVAAALFIGIVAARVLWERQFAGLRPPASRWAKVQRLAQWAGIAPPDYLTPVEAAQSMALVVGETPGLRRLAADYTRDRYGRGATQEAEADAREADRTYRQVRDRLRGLLLYRLTHFGRVRQSRASAGRYAASTVGRR